MILENIEDFFFILNVNTQHNVKIFLYAENFYVLRYLSVWFSKYEFEEKIQSRRSFQ